MDKNLNSIKVLFLVGCLLISTIAIVLVITSLTFFTGSGVASWQFPVSFILAGILYFYFSKQYYIHNRIFFTSFLISTAVIIASILIAVSFYDVSYDGQNYHMESIYQLKNGWNPFVNLLPQSDRLIIYINHYPKGVELPQSTIYSLTNHIEAGKSTNLMLMVAAFCLSLSYLINLNKLSTIKCILLSLLATLNPIVVNQLISTYVDGQLAILILCFFIAVLWIITDVSYYNLLLLGAIIIITANIKFTGLVYMVIFTLAFLAWLLFSQKKHLFKKTFYTVIISGTFAVFIVGYNPYIINTVKFQHPFYPLMGKNKVDIMGNNLPKGFEGKSAISKFFISIFARTNNVMPDNGRKVELKIPFAVNKTDIVNASKIDTRIGGFGPLFSGGILLSAILLVTLILSWGNKEGVKNSLYTMLIISISVIIIPESWWARYVPQLWYIPLIILFTAELYENNKARILRTLTYIILGVNIVFTFIALGWNLMMTSLAKYQIENLKASKQTVVVQWGSAKSNRIRFKENNVPFIERNLDDVPNTENIIRSDSKFIIPANITNIPKSKFVQWAEKYQQTTEK